MSLSRPFPTIASHPVLCTKSACPRPRPVAGKSGGGQIWRGSKPDQPVTTWRSPPMSKGCRLTALLLALVLASCTGKPAKPNAVALKGAGATFPAVLYDDWFATYDRDHPDVSIEYEAVGSGEGVKRFLAGTVDFGASDDGLTQDEVKQVSRGVLQ